MKHELLIEEFSNKVAEFVVLLDSSDWGITTEPVKHKSDLVCSIALKRTFRTPTNTAMFFVLKYEKITKGHQLTS